MKKANYFELIFATNVSKFDITKKGQKFLLLKESQTQPGRCFRGLVLTLQNKLHKLPAIEIIPSSCLDE